MTHNRILSLSLLAAVGGLSIAATLPTLLQDPEKPTEHHARVLEAVGEWEGTLTSFMPGMDSEPVAAKETVTAVGGFWVQTRFECNFMGPYAGSGHIGYDPKAKKYIGTWVDNMSSYFARMEGEYDEEKGALVMHWDAPNMEGKIESHCYESVYDGDKYTNTFFTGDDKTKSMVIEMKRVGGAAVDAAADKK